MSHVRAEVLRVSRSRTGWREGGGGGGGSNGSNPSPATSPGQIQYINSLKSTFEEGGGSSSTNGDKQQQQQPSHWHEETAPSNFVRPQRQAIGSKVSTIANMFQAMAPPPPISKSAFKLDSPQNNVASTGLVEKAGHRVQSPDVIQVQKDLHRRPSLETTATSPSAPPSGISVHLNRTESQVARFNSARAMFERLEEKILVQTSKTSGTVSPRRGTYSSSSRSPSPTVTQSVGCSPKRGSPALSPREKSRSEDNIVSELPSSSTSNRSSSHVNGRGHQQHNNNLDLDLTCSGAGEAIVSPGPLSPHLARYLAENNLLAVSPKCVAAEEKTTAASKKFFSSSSPKPTPLCPKPTAAELVFAKTAVVATKRPCPKREESGGVLFSRRSHQTFAASEATSHIQVAEIAGDERPILIGVVEKKTPSAQSILFHSHVGGTGSGPQCNGRVTLSRDPISSSKTPALYESPHIQRPSALPTSAAAAVPSPSTGICHNLAEPRSKPLPPPPQQIDDDEEDDLRVCATVVEATNQQLLREVQSAFNRGSSDQSGSQILVLSSTTVPADANNYSNSNSSLLHATAFNGSSPSSFVAKVDQADTAKAQAKSPLASAEAKVAFLTTASVANQEVDDNFAYSSKANSTSPLSPVDRTSRASLSSFQLGSDDGYGFSTQGTSPLSPKADCGAVSLKVSVPQSPVNGDSTARSKGSVDHPFLTGAEATTDFPEVMTPEEANRLLSSSSDDNVNDDHDEPVLSTKMAQRNSWFDGSQEDEQESPFEGKDLERSVESLERSVTQEEGDDGGDSAQRLSVTTGEYGRLEHEEDGVHIFEDGHFWLEIPGLLESDNEEVIQSYGAIITPKRRDRVKFSTKPIRVYSTFSVSDYDRRNDDVDPVSASAEYELEKRVEKMDVFPVELLKGPEGLGLSIIGMGVGADAGLEKLGIFVKTITDGGAAYKDGRIDVNDQIIEVDGKSLVGVTQAYAASVLRNTSGLVRFLIGREKDGENSEVAQLISQSLQADREREYRRKNYEQELSQQRQNSDGGGRSDNGYPGLTLPIPSLAVQPSATTPLDPQIIAQQEDSTPEEGEDEPTCEVFDLEGSSESPSPDSSDARIKLKEVTILERLQCEREEYENRIRMLTVRLAEVERIVDGAKDEVTKYQNMLEESQGEYIVLEKKYYKAKKLIKECQQREQDLLNREDYHIQQLQEKDQEYNALVKSLKDRVIQLEQELMETQRAAGLPVKLPYDNSSIKMLQLTPQLLRRPQADSTTTTNQRKRSSSLLDTDISDSELGDSSSNQFDISPDSDDMETKTSTVERKPLAKDGGDLFEKAVPQHELLDSTAAKTKAELASKLGSLANRQPPSLKKTSSSGSSGDGPPFDSRDSDSNDTSLGSSREDLACADPELAVPTTPVLLPATLCSISNSVTTTTSPPATSNSTEERPTDPRNSVHLAEQAPSKDRFKPTSSDATATSSSPTGRGSPVRIDGKFAEEIRIILERKSVEAKRQVASEEPSCTQEKYVHSTGHGHLLADVPRNMTPSPMSTASSLDSSSSNTTGGSDGAVTARPSPSTAVHSFKREFTMSERVDNADEIESHEVTRGPLAAPSIIGDHGVTSTGNSSDRRPHQWHSCSVSDWSSGQVGQWLLALSMEQYISVFMDNNVGGQELLNMDGNKLKNMGVTNSNDRSVLKRRVKDLKALVEKERKAMEKELRAKEKNQKKAERAAEKAVQKRK